MTLLVWFEQGVVQSVSAMKKLWSPAASGFVATLVFGFGIGLGAEQKTLFSYTDDERGDVVAAHLRRSRPELRPA